MIIIAIFMTLFSRFIQNKFIFKLPINSEVVFVSYAVCTVSYSYIGHYVGNYSMYVNIVSKSTIWPIF